MESKKQSIKHNASLLIFARIINASLTYLFVFIISNKLDINGIGLYGLAFSIYQLLSLFSGMGTLRYGVRELIHRRNEERFILSKIFTLRLIAVFVGLIAILIYLSLTRQDFNHSTVIILMASGALFETLESSLDILFISYERFAYQVIPRLILGVLYVITAITAVFMDHPLLIIAILFSGTSFIQTIIKIIIAKRKYFIPKLNFNFNDIFILFKKVIPFGLSFFMGLLFFKIDIVVIEGFFDKAPAGLYFLASLIIMYPFQVFALIVMAVLPSFALQYNNGKLENFVTSVKKLRYFLGGLSLLLGILIFFTAPFIVNILYPSQDVETITKLVRLLCIFIPLNAYSMCNEMGLQLARNEWLVGGGLTVIGTINIILNLILIPIWGVFGAGIATIFTILLKVIFFQLKFSFKTLSKTLSIN